jgi:hypothetical protein
MCEALFAAGHTVTASRRGFERQYDLAERVLPAAVRGHGFDLPHRCVSVFFSFPSILFSSFCSLVVNWIVEVSLVCPAPTLSSGEAVVISWGSPQPRLLKISSVAYFVFFPNCFVFFLDL